jgi:hypothetical protein
VPSEEPRRRLRRGTWITPPEQDISFIAEEDAWSVVGLVRRIGEVLFGFTNVLVDDRREIDSLGVFPGIPPSSVAVNVLPVPGGPQDNSR